MEKPASSNVSQPAGKPEKKRRRRRRFLPAAGLLLAGIVWMGPYFLSTGPGRDLIVSVINSRIKGTFGIGEISLSWLGPCRVKNLQAMDLAGREVLRVEKISLDAGLLGLLKDAEHFGQALAASPRVTLYLNAKGTPSLAEALEPVKPSARQVAPAPKGSIAVTDGTVTIIRADGREYEIRGINATANLDRPGLVEGRIDLAPAGGGRLSIAFNLSNLADGGGFRLDGMRGDFRLVTDEPADLGRLVAFAGSRSVIDGAVRADLTGTIVSGRITADFDLAVLGLRSGGANRLALRPIDLNLTGNFSATAGKISGKGWLTGEAGNLRATFSYEPSDAPLQLSWEKILAAAFSGESITLPAVSLAVTKAQINLPILAGAVPALLKVLPDVEITSGTILAEDVSIHGGARPAVRGRVVLDELQARKGQTEVSCRPISLSLNAAIDRQAGLEIDTFEFTSSSAGVTGKGTASDFEARYRLDMDRFHKKLGKIFDLGSAFPQGRIEGKVKLARRQAGRVDFISEFVVTDFEYRTDERTLYLDSLRTEQKGYLLLRKRRLLEAVVTAGEIKLAKELQLGIAGRYHFKEKAFQCDVDVKQADLLPLEHRFGDWIPAGLPKISGSLIGEIAVSIGPGGKDPVSGGNGVRLSGNGRIKELSIRSGDRTFSGGDVAFAHVAVLDRDMERITLEKMDVVSKALSLRMGGTIDRLGSEWVLDLAGSYEGSWEDLTVLLHELAPATKAKISFAGKTGGKVVVTGPARRPSVRPSFRAVTAKTTLGWTQADVFGITLKHAELSPVLTDGQVRIPETVIAAGDGKVRPFGTLDMRGEYPVLRLPGLVRVLENLKLTPQLNEELLTRFNPIFARLADVEGVISLDTDNLVLPLSGKIRHLGRGGGHLDLQKLKVRPKGILAELVKLSTAGVKGRSSVQVRGVDFVIRDGRINYDNFTLVFPGGFDLKFYGSVGFDDTLDLAVSVPISARLLEKFGVRGPVIEYAGLLAGTRIDIPMAGSRLKPRLDFSKVDIRPLINRAIQALLARQAGKMLEGVLKDKAKDKDTDPLLDSLFNLLKKPKPPKP